MDRYIGDIIASQRFDTRNSDSDAISDAQFLRYNNQAQRYLYSLISLSYSYAFENEITTSIVAGQGAYTVNDKLAFGTRITTVYYIPDTANPSYRYRLSPTPKRYGVLQTGTRPRYYRRRGGQVILEPTPTSSVGSLVIVYERDLDTLDLRRGRINGTPSGTTIDLTHPSGAPTTADEALFVQNAYVCISDSYGNPLLYNGVISSYDSGTDVLTLAANVDTYLVDGVVLADLADQYVTIGKYTSTHSSLPNQADDFFVEYVNRKVHGVDSSDEIVPATGMMRELLDAIIESYKMADKDVKPFPVDNFDLLIPEYSE